MAKKKYDATLIENNGKPLKALKLGRNEECFCGSGKKFKNCCNTDTAYLSQRTQPYTVQDIEQHGKHSKPVKLLIFVAYKIKLFFKSFFKQ